MPRRPKYDKGRWRIERERCRIPFHIPESPRPEKETIGDVIPDVMRRLKLEGLHWTMRLADEWAGIVGPAVAAHTRPGQVQGKLLVIFVDSSAWLNELRRFHEPQILKNVQEYTGKDHITKIRLQVDPGEREES
jgi:hypothetical protein